MILRKLQEKDAVRMLEWMHDPQTVQHLQKDFAHMTLDDCMRFVAAAQDTGQSMHMSVCDDQDVYQGTISLKNIDLENRNAEYAVSMHGDAQGKGFAVFGTREILKIAFETLNLEKVYLNVLEDNPRAIRFYEKMNFHREGVFEKHIYQDGRYKDLLWYCMFRTEYLNGLTGR